jgi:hypothetical protein
MSPVVDLSSSRSKAPTTLCIGDVGLSTWEEIDRVLASLELESGSGQFLQV